VGFKPTSLQNLRFDDEYPLELDGGFSLLNDQHSHQDFAELFKRNASFRGLEMDAMDQKIDRRYDLYDNGQKFSLLENEDKIANRWQQIFLKNGLFHNLCGPALSRSDGKEIYAINGTILSLDDYIYNHPIAEKIKLSTYSWKFETNNYSLFKTNCASVVINKEKCVKNVSRPQQFLLHCLFGNEFDFSHIEKFNSANNDLRELFGFLSTIDGNHFKCTSSSFSLQNEIYYVDINFDKNVNRIRCSIYTLPIFEESESFDEFEIDLNSSVDSESGLQFFNLKDDHKDRVAERKKAGTGWTYLEQREREREFENNRLKIDEAVGAAKTVLRDKLVSEYVAGSEIESSEEFNQRLDGLIKNMHDESKKIYGVSVPPKYYETIQYDPKTSFYYWKNSENKIESPNPNFPSIIGPDGALFHHKNGFLHNESGPAIWQLNSAEGRRWFLWGHEVTKEEFERYDPKSKEIVFLDEASRYHRDNGPALVKYCVDNSKISKFYTHGVETNRSEITSPDVSKIRPVTKKKPKVVKVTNTASANHQIYTELTPDEVQQLKAIFRDHIDHLRKFEPEIREAARKALINKGLPPDLLDKKPEPVPEPAKEEDKSDMEVRKNVRAGLETNIEATRTDQLVTGFKFGFKKGVVNNASKLIAEKLVGMTPMADNKLLERFVQVCFLLGSAELIQRMPEGMGEKMKMDEEFRLNTAQLLRYVSGDNIGRDLVDLAADVIPMFAEALQDMTSEELADLTTDLESQVSEESEGEELFKPVEVEEEVEEVAKVVAR
jgi:hypothetical protein